MGPRLLLFNGQFRALSAGALREMDTVKSTQRRKTRENNATPSNSQLPFQSRQFINLALNSGPAPSSSSCGINSRLGIAIALGVEMEMGVGILAGVGAMCPTSER